MSPSRENAAFEEQLTDARRRLEDGTPVASASGLVKRYSEAPRRPGRSSGPRRLLVALLQFDMAVDTWIDDIAPLKLPLQGFDFGVFETDRTIASHRRPLPAAGRGRDRRSLLVFALVLRAVAMAPSRTALSGD